MEKRSYRKSVKSRKWYHVMDADGNFYAGLKGGYPTFTHDYKESHPVPDLIAVARLEKMSGRELIYEEELIF